MMRFQPGRAFSEVRRITVSREISHGGNHAAIPRGHRHVPRARYTRVADAGKHTILGIARGGWTSADNLVVFGNVLGGECAACALMSMAARIA